MNYRDDYTYDDQEIVSAGLQRGAPPIGASIDPSADKGIEIENEMEDLDAARVKNTSMANRSGFRNHKRVFRKGEYESYYS